MKAILVLKYSKKTNSGNKIYHGVYEDVEEFKRLTPVHRGMAFNSFHDSEFMYQCVSVPFFTSGGIKSDMKDSECTVSRRALRTVHQNVPSRSERNYNFMTVLQAESSANQKIAVLCGGDFSTVKFENDDN